MGRQSFVWESHKGRRAKSFATANVLLALTKQEML